MSEIPEGQYYTKEHEWLRVEGDEIIIGITDYAQHALTDIVYIEPLTVESLISNLYSV